MFVQLYAASEAGNIQASLELGTLYLWGNRTLLPTACFGAVGMFVGSDGVDQLLRARGDLSIPLHVKSHPSPIESTQYLAQEYLVVVHLARLRVKSPIFPSDYDALQQLVPLASVADVSSPRDRMISRIILSSHYFSGAVLPQDCGQAQVMLVTLAQACVVRMDQTALYGTPDVMLWDAWEDMFTAQEAEERPQLMNYYK